MIPLATSIFSALDIPDDLISETEVVLAIYVAALAIVLVFVVAFHCIERFKRRSPVEKILRRRFG